MNLQNNKLEIKEIEDIPENEKNQSNNLLLFSIALLQLIKVFKNEIKNDISNTLNFNIYKINHFITVILLIISLLIIYLFLKKGNVKYS